MDGAGTQLEGMDMDQAAKHGKKKKGKKGTDEEKKGYRKAADSALLECTHDECSRRFTTETAAEDHALAVHSHDEVRAAIAKALRARYMGPPRAYTYVETTADDWFVFEVEGSYGVEAKLYRMEFTFADGEATLVGEPVEVRRRMVYEPVAQASA